MQLPATEGCVTFILIASIMQGEAEKPAKEPIYAMPTKPETKKISRPESERILEGADVGDYMLRRNKETVCYIWVPSGT